MIKIHLARILADRHLKQLQLAEIAGVRPNAINNLCNANNPTVKSGLQRIDLDILNRICRALDIQPGYLLEYVSDERPDFVESQRIDNHPYTKEIEPPTL